MHKNSLISFCLLIAFAFAYLPLCAMIEKGGPRIDDQESHKSIKILSPEEASFGKKIDVSFSYARVLKGFLDDKHMTEEERWSAVYSVIVNKLADPNELFVDGDSPLEYVVREQKDKKYVSLLLDAGARFDRVSNLETTPLEWAISYGLHEHAQLLLKAGAFVNRVFTIKETSVTLLGKALLYDDLKMMEIFLQSGADPDAMSGGMTPLGRAISRNNRAQTNLLLAYGASLYVPVASGGLLPLPYALLCKDYSLVELLLKAGADPNSTYSKSSGRKRSMLYAAVAQCPKKVELLLKYGALVNHQDERGNTILHYAAKGEKLSEIGVLLEFGASKTIRNHKLKTPVQCAPERFRRIFQNMQTRLIAPKKIDRFHTSRS